MAMRKEMFSTLFKELSISKPNPSVSLSILPHSNMDFKKWRGE
jgi:hypothetical protein